MNKHERSFIVIFYRDVKINDLIRESAGFSTLQFG